MKYEIKKGLGAVVLAEIDRQGFNKSNFCLMVGLDRVTFRKVLDGTGNSTINTLIKISRGLDIPLSTLFERAEKIEQEMAQRRKQTKVPQKAATADAQDAGAFRYIVCEIPEDSPNDKSARKTKDKNQDAGQDGN